MYDPVDPELVIAYTESPGSRLNLVGGTDADDPDPVGGLMGHPSLLLTPLFPTKAVTPTVPGSSVVIWQTHFWSMVMPDVTSTAGPV